jgi:hypothetical protein
LPHSSVTTLSQDAVASESTANQVRVEIGLGVVYKDLPVGKCECKTKLSMTRLGLSIRNPGGGSDNSAC